MIGQTFGKLTVVERAESGKRGQSRWRCRCECGKTTMSWANGLKRGRVLSCGCGRAKHGHAGTPEYQAWANMNHRCYDLTIPDYVNYGARGIKVCDRWRNSVDAFVVDMGPRPPGTTLDRIDNSKGYEPGNCRWATRTEQNRNRRSVRAITFMGRTQLLSDWAAELGLNASTISMRLDAYGWTLERALRPKGSKTCA